MTPNYGHGERNLTASLLVALALVALTALFL